MRESIQKLRVVVASPADVTAERDIVPLVVQELNRSVGADRGLHAEVIRWETDSYPGFHPDGPQGLIDPVLGIEDCDVLVGIFWKRFGTPTKGSGSGTVHEFQLAYEAWKRKHRPQVMVYFNQRSYTPQSKEETDQWGQVLEFRKTFPKEGLWWPYRGTSKFEKLFRTHLTNFIRDNFPVGTNPNRDNASSQTARPERPDYFTVQSRIIAEYTGAFVGRANAKKALQQFLENHERGYFIVQGSPGQGKTAFLCHLVKESRYVHHFISRTGGRADSRLILRSLVSQLLSPASAGERIAESLPELTKTFEELLARAHEDRDKTVIVIDALDELPSKLIDDPPYLVAETLPRGVFLIVTSRPGELLDRLQERLFSVPKQVYELGPLDISEMRDILLAARLDITTAEVERVAEASQGNPLYLRAVAAELQINRLFNLQTLPSSIDGFFRSAMSSLGNGNMVLEDVLGLLSVARIALSIAQLSRIVGSSQREVFEDGIIPIRQFLLEIDGAYTFYHSRFHEFVTKTILYEDELRESHRRMVDWLQLPENSDNEYRLASLAYHLFESGNSKALTSIVDEQFLNEKVRRSGYAVLEDVELWTRALLQLGDAALVERCVSLVESLRKIAGGDVIPAARRMVQAYRSGPESFRGQLIEPTVQPVPGLDVYVGVLPKAEVAADFFEIIPIGHRLVLAIGDAPSIGLKSAFVARFVGNLFHTLAERSAPLRLGELLGQLNSTVRGYEYFQRISMQCAEIDPEGGILRIANAGHPYPVHFSFRRRKCDILPLRGDLLDNSLGESPSQDNYEEYALTIEPGDVFVFVTDGLTEDHIIRGDPYGYRFTGILESKSQEGARAIGEAILDSWKAHPREEDAGDDVSVVVIAVGQRNTARLGH